MENSKHIPQKIKNRTTTGPSNSTPGYLSEKNEDTSQKKYKNPYVHCCIIYKSKTGKQPKCTLRDEWRKMWYTHTYTQQNITQPKQ